jgi:hypothetical protein
MRRSVDAAGSLIPLGHVDRAEESAKQRIFPHGAHSEVEETELFGAERMSQN